MGFTNEQGFFNAINDADTHLIYQYDYYNKKHGDKENIEIYKQVDNTWKKVKTKRDGKYIVFEADKNNIVFRVKESKNNYINIIAFNIVITLAFIIFIRNFKNNK